MSTTNGSTNSHNGVHHPVDEQIDTLYAWMPGTTPAPQPCPEAAFSLTLKGQLDGIEALFTVRGQTAREFTANLAAVRGLLDQPQPTSSNLEKCAMSQPQGQGKGFCQKHGVAMKQTTKEGRSWFSHYDEAAGRWCKGK